MIRSHTTKSSRGDVMEMKSLNSDTAVVSLTGEMNFLTEEKLLNLISDTAQTNVKHLILDFSGVDHFNSDGAATLVKTCIIARSNKISLHSFGLSDRYQEIFQLTGLINDILPIQSGQNSTRFLSDNIYKQLKEMNESRGARDNKGWSTLKSKLIVSDNRPNAININVNNRTVLGPLQGFGSVLEKEYKLQIPNSQLSAQELMSKFRSSFITLQPPQNVFYPSSKGIEAGETVLIDSSTPGGVVSTGVHILFSDDVSFSFITPQGHPEAGWITFSASEKDEKIEIKIRGLASASDPFFELAFRLAGSKFQERIWKTVLANMAKSINVDDNIILTKKIIDKKLHWKAVRNLWFNAQLRSLPYNVPYYLKKLFNK